MPSTGSPLSPESFAYVYDAIAADLLLSSISGGTDIVSCFALGNPTLPVWRGELQTRGLGMAVEVWNEQGEPVVGEWLAALRAAVSDARYRPGFDILYDRTRLTHIPDANYLRTWLNGHARLMKEIGGPRLAVVVTEPVIYGMIRMASILAEDRGAVVNVFWNEKDALKWLGR